MTPKTFRC